MIHSATLQLYRSPTRCPPILFSSIIRIESEVNYSFLFLTSGEKIATSKTLKSIETNLNEQPMFIRTSKSHIVNTAFVSNYKITNQGGFITLQNGMNLPVSRRRAKQILEILGKY